MIMIMLLHWKQGINLFDLFIVTSTKLCSPIVDYGRDFLYMAEHGYVDQGRS